MDKKNIMRTSETEDAKIINACFRGSPIILQSTYRNKNDLNIINSHNKFGHFFSQILIKDINHW